MAQIRVSGIGGLDLLAAALQASKSEAPRRVSEAVAASTRKGGLLARANAPVRTGHLKANIRDTSSALSGLVVSDAGYSGFVNWGTSRQAPNEYMGRAFEAVKPEFVEAVEQAGAYEL